jgi:diaminopimelate decarboxylase
MAPKKRYEKPIIIRHTVGLANKFGRAPGTLPMSRIDGFPVHDLVEKFGSPLYVVSEETLRRKYREMVRAFAVRYPRVQIAYSYKTNYLGAVCAALHREGAWAEVVSGFEYSIARELKVPGGEIVFNGPYKTKEELRRAVSDGAMVNIDSYDEMYILEEVARETKQKIKVGVRVNMEIGLMPWERFGFNVESGQAYDAIKRIVSNGLLHVRGLHLHAGTYIDNVDFYRQAAEKLVDFYARIGRELKVKLDYWDMGGGYASSNTLHTAYLTASQTCPTFDEYAEAIGPTLLRGPFGPHDVPLLILEPGRAIVDEAMQLVTTVYSTKRLASGSKSYVVDAGVNLLFASFWYRYEITPVKEAGMATEESSVYGPLCMQIDCLRPSVALPQLRAGDLLVVRNIGAYNFSQSMQFIQPRPAVVMIAGGHVHVVREAETPEYIRKLERVPDHLTKT